MYNGLAFLYSNMGTTKKERLSTILEPLQSMVQLSLLTFSPVGSKVSIYENLLSIQVYKWNQSIIRNYYNDKKDDLYYLFNVINRFNKFYVNKAENELQKNLFNLLNELAYSGLSNLIQTYISKNDISIINTLKMYKSMVKNPTLCQAYENEKSEIDFDITQKKNDEKERKENNESREKKKINKDNMNNNTINSSNTIITSSSNSSSNNISNSNSSNNSSNNNLINYENSNTIKNIDDLFVNIKLLYKDYHYQLIYNFLLMIKNDEINYGFYIEGLSLLFTPINVEIKNWINSNLSC